MTLAELIHYIRTNLQVQLPDGETDSAYLALSNDDIELYIQMALAKEYPGTPLEHITEDKIYLTYLSTRKEIYYQLASSTAPYYPIGADGVSISKNTRFDHYAALIRQTQYEIDHFKSTGAQEKSELDADNNIITPTESGDVQIGSLLNKNNYFTPYNVNRALLPVAELRVDRITSLLAEVSWTLSRVNRFHKYELYYATSPTALDMYATTNEERFQNLTKSAELYDIHLCKYRFISLLPNTTYYFVLVVYEENSLVGISQVSATTLAGA